jgi:hypothetical protein
MRIVVDCVTEDLCLVQEKQECDCYGSLLLELPIISGSKGEEFRLRPLLPTQSVIYICRPTLYMSEPYADLTLPVLDELGEILAQIAKPLNHTQLVDDVINITKHTANID